MRLRCPVGALFDESPGETLSAQPAGSRDDAERPALDGPADERPPMLMDRVDQLRVFVRIASCGSFSLAAEQLGLPRSTVSLAVHRLESRLGARLLHRTSRHVGLTRDGATLLERARPLLADVEDAWQQFRYAGGAVAGRLRVGVPGRIARHLIAPALPALLDLHPHLDVELLADARAADLVQQGIDCALCVGQVAPHSLVARRLGALALANCASPAYLVRYGTPAGPRDLAQHFVVGRLPQAGGGTAPWHWVEDRQPYSDAVPSRVGADDADTAIELALAGLGLIQILAFDVHEHLRSGALVRVMPQAEAPPLPVHAVYPHRPHPSGRLQVLVDWVAALLAPHFAAEEPPGGAR